MRTNAGAVRRSSRRAAEHATFQSFANCYLREIDAGAFAPGRAAPDCIECALPSQQATLRMEVLALSRCGPHRFGRPLVRRAAETGWREVEPFSALQLLLREAYGRLGPERAEGLRACELELLARALDSCQSTARYLDARRPQDEEDDSFIAAEQSLAFGHWMHPTPKSRQGMTSWQEPAYAPELGGAFRLVWFAADATLVRNRSAARATAPEIVAALLGAEEAARLGLRPGEALLPMHPLQADALLLDPDVRALMATGALRALGPAGSAFTATSSVRTVYSAGQPWMLKFSLPVRITNSVRTNRRHELEAGVTVAELFARTGFSARHPRFRVIQDPAYVTLEMPGRAESGFEVIFRENPFVTSSEDGAVAVAALTADPAPGEASRLERIVRGLSERSGASTAEVSRRWFAAYLDCALDPLVALYDELGVALEAHQQNSLLDVRLGYPQASYYRDSQGFYLSERHRGRLCRIVPEAQDIAQLFFPDDEIQERFAYYLIVNQVFSVVARMGRDGLADEDGLLDMLRERLEGLARRMTGLGRDFARRLLDRPTIAAKANLVTRLYDIDELEAGAADEAAVYTRLPNPLFRHGARATRGEAHALAV